MMSLNLSAASSTIGDIASLALGALPARIDPIALFLQADIVVQLVMAGLLLASVWVWTIIIAFSLRMARVERQHADFESDFWKAKDPAKLLDKSARATIPAARVAAAGYGEWKKSTASPPIDREATRERIRMAMEGRIAEEADALAERLNFLATTGAVAPFVGLFGTVWGIMNSFFQIGLQQNSSLAVVAPGISEALFATAIGLFAAIPAVIAYNRFSHRVNRFEARLARFAEKFHAALSRDLERR